MLDRKEFLQAAKLIAQARCFIVAVHIDPDGDAWGSLAAFGRLLANLGKQYQLYCRDVPPDSLLPLLDLRGFTNQAEDLAWSAADLLVTLDCGSHQRCQLPVLSRPTTCMWLDIDHHPPVENLADFSLRDRTAAATCELVRDLALEAGWLIDPAMAKALLLGLVADTGNFTYPSTSSHSLATAASLCAAGAHLPRLSGYGNGSLSLEALRLWGKALMRLALTDQDWAITFLLAEDFPANQVEPELEGLAGFLAVTREAKAVLLLKQAGAGTVKGSWRSVVGGPDVGSWARSLGGGGHERAAGFTVMAELECQNQRLFFRFPDQSLVLAIDWLKELISA